MMVKNLHFRLGQTFQEFNKRRKNIWPCEHVFAGRLARPPGAVKIRWRGRVAGKFDNLWKKRSRILEQDLSSASHLVANLRPFGNRGAGRSVKAKYAQPMPAHPDTRLMKQHLPIARGENHQMPLVACDHAKPICAGGSRQMRLGRFGKARFSFFLYLALLLTCSSKYQAANIFNRRVGGRHVWICGSRFLVTAPAHQSAFHEINLVSLDAFFKRQLDHYIKHAITVLFS